MRKSLIIILFFITAINWAQGQPQQFTLQEAIDYALENSRTAKNAARDIEAARQQKWETTATGLPQLEADIGYQNFIKQPISLIPAEFFGGNPGEFAEIAFGTKQTMNAVATVRQKIFDGSYLVGLQSAKVFLEISKNAKEKTDLEVRKAVINAYGNVLLAEESIRILERNIDVLEKNLDETTKIYENGLGEEESVEQLQITLSGIESNLNNTTRLKDLAYQMFNMTIGLDIYNETVLSDNLSSLTAQNTVLSLLEADEDVEKTIDFKIAENDKVSKELLLKLEKSKALPVLDAFINGGYNGNSDEFTFTNRDQQWFGSSVLGVNMNIPIFSSGMRSAATQRARINLEKAQDDLTETEQRLKLQIASAKSDYKFAIEDYENKRSNLDLAERIEKKNQVKFFEGIASSFELRQAQTQLYATQQEFLQAMLDVINKKAELETVLNEIPKN
ncbi:MAG: TolC family protein [Bacteroidia bacterium]|nr:TolC family protein [Bacteroidia bacterium]MBT8310701.1 TolC family protein [Bacteroidia bacterium]NND10645.1 TolC family protein [Flavobacteriaceae bacterium]NNK26859.1 TolC family protein [Flavobacteriaceae bacterium]NNL61391.1 TolC family protein [Flavobacteriaceae bacterium]